MSLETGVWNYGKTEACPARLVASLATPEEKSGISPNKPLTDALTIRKSLPRYPFPASTQICSTEP